MIALLVVRLAEIYPPLVRIRPTIVAATIVGALLAQRVRPQIWRVVLQQPVMKWLALYFAAILVTIPFAIWPGGAFGILYVLPFMGLMFAAILVCEPTRDTLDRLIRWTVLIGGGYAAYVMVFGSIIIDNLGGARLGGLGMYDPNDLAVLAVIIMQLAIGMALRERALWRVVGAAAATITVIVALKTGSRGGTLALTTGILTLLLAQKPSRFFALATIIAIAIPLAWMFGPESFRVRTASFLNIGNDYTFTTDAGRWIIWQRGLGYFIRRPIIGIGPSGYGLREGEFFASQGRTGAWLTAHNTYLQVLVELGIFGGVALCGMIAAAVRGAVPLWRRPKASAPNRLYRPEIFAMLTGFLAGALFLSHAYSPMLFFTLALAVYAGRVYQTELQLGGAAHRSPPVRNGRTVLRRTINSARPAARFAAPLGRLVT
ncbi:MAG TPA: O-antigen ligase family protein [Gemmatirosa sp.]